MLYATISVPLSADVKNNDHLVMMHKSAKRALVLVFMQLLFNMHHPPKNCCRTGKPLYSSSTWRAVVSQTAQYGDVHHSAKTLDVNNTAFKCFISQFIIEQVSSKKKTTSVHCQCSLDHLRGPVGQKGPPTATLKSPVKLTHMYLDFGKKLVFPERTHTDMSKTCKHRKAPGGSNPGDSCCKAVVLTITPPCCAPLHMSNLLQSRIKQKVKLGLNIAPS